MINGRHEILSASEGAARLRGFRPLHPRCSYFTKRRQALNACSAKIVHAQPAQPHLEAHSKMQLAPYLFFNGTCEQALTFYAGVLGGEISGINRFAESPMGEQMPPDQRNRIMHATFTAPGITLMASDGNEADGEMRRASLSLASANSDEGARVFAALADGGKITMPYSKQFWGASFGMLVDKYGICWMVNAG